MKILAFLTKKNGMTAQAFKEYYEHKHVPFICSLATPPPVYKRSYVLRGDSFNQGEETLDFDVVTEMVFADRAAYERWTARIFAPGVGEQVIADESNFLDRSRTRAYLFDESITTK